MVDKSKDLVKREAEVPAAAERASSRPTFLPNVDIYQTQDGTRVLADMPGVDAANVGIELEEGILTIRGSVPDEALAEHELQYAEYRAGDYERSFTLGDTVDRDKIEGAIKNGVLTITVPKSVEGKGARKRIEVKTKS